jgi:NADP-dependent aldehyde dehydrogenase
VTLGSGQFCTNPGLFLALDTPDTHAFIENVKQRMEAREPGLLLNAAIEAGLARTVQDTLTNPAVKLLTGAKVIEEGGYCYANTLMQTDSTTFRAAEGLQVEHFGPVTLFVLCASPDDLHATVSTLHGSLTAAIHGTDDELDSAGMLYNVLRERAGRLIWNGFPTGVEVVYSMQHGGPYPATTAPATTSVGMTAIKRFLRPVAFQDVPEPLLPDALKNNNPLGIWRIVDNVLTREPVQ